MNKVLLIKYGELSTKKDNRNYFVNILASNIKKKLSKYDVVVHKERYGMYIEFCNDDLDNIISIIDKVFGIYKYHIAYVVNTNDDDIKSGLFDILSNRSFSTFKVDTKRGYKDFPMRSQDYNRVLGSLILKKFDNVSVDVHNPDLLVKVEIREDITFIYCDSYLGSGGYPVGTQSKGMLMLSGGIDSPVAGYLAMKRGVVLDAVYFEAIPHTSLEARNKVLNLCKKLSCYGDSINLHIVNFTPIQEEIYKRCREDYCITIMRRMMYRIMEKLANMNNAYVIVNGESIGQVASQTLTSMSVINEVTCVPVIRPVACLDKLEIIEIAKKIDTYDISIIPFEDCCTVFVPKHPVINPKINIVKNEENKLDYERMIEDAVSSINTICISETMENDFSDLL